MLKVKIHKKEIIDQKRINFILKKIKKKSIQTNIDPKITNRIWKNMIWSFIDYEKRNFAVGTGSVRLPAAVRPAGGA